MPVTAAAVPGTCLLYTSPSPRDISGSRMPSCEKTAYEILRCLVGSEMCIRDRILLAGNLAQARM
ncbi:hypothetical protein ACX3V1_10475, partial [Escherichia coli]